MTTNETNEKGYTAHPFSGEIKIFLRTFLVKPEHDLIHVEMITYLGEKKIAIYAKESSREFFEKTKNLPRPSGTLCIGKNYCNPISIGVLLKTSDEMLFFVRCYLRPNEKYIDRNNNIISEIEAINYKLNKFGIDKEKLKTPKAIGIVFDNIKQPCIVFTVECNLTSSEVKSLSPKEEELVFVPNNKESLEKFMESHIPAQVYLGVMELYKINKGW